MSRTKRKDSDDHLRPHSFMMFGKECKIEPDPKKNRDKKKWYKSPKWYKKLAIRQRRAKERDCVKLDKDVPLTKRDNDWNWN